MSDILETMRRELDAIDTALVDALGQRLALCRRIASYKREHGIPMMQPHRVELVKRRCAALGEQRGLAAQFMVELYTLIIAEACRIEDDIIDARPERS
jgi:chorismate mutase-like protein